MSLVIALSISGCTYFKSIQKSPIKSEELPAGDFDKYVKSSRLYSQESELGFMAEYSSVKPYIDGNLEEEEIIDANHYVVDGGNDSTFDIYTKWISPINDQPLPPRVNDGPQLYIGMRITHWDIEPCLENPGYCDTQHIYLYFDEGDDGSFGAGSGDDELNFNQEDIKSGSDATAGMSCNHFFGFVIGCPNPSCDPRNQENCWECQDDTVYGPDFWGGSHCEHVTTGEVVEAYYSKKISLMDGLWDSRVYGPGWYSEGYGNSGGYDRINFMFYMTKHDGFLDAEFLVPLVGLDAFSGGSFDDESDITTYIQEGDILGFGIRALMDGDSQDWLNVPVTLNRFDALTYARLEIKKKPVIVIPRDPRIGR